MCNYKPESDEKVDMLQSDEAYKSMKDQATSLPLVTLNDRQLCDLEMLLNGAFNPLSGFMSQKDYESVLNTMALDNGLLWPIPITLDVSKEELDKLNDLSEIGLCDHEGFMLGVMRIESIWPVEKDKEADKVYGTRDLDHPGVHYLYTKVKDFYLGGVVEGIKLPIHYDFEALRNTPSDLMHEFKRLGWNKVMAFHTSKPMHRVHHEITIRAAKSVGASILIHPVAGVGKPGDMAYYSRVHCYQAIQKYYPNNLVMLCKLTFHPAGAAPKTKNRFICTMETFNKIS